MARRRLVLALALAALVGLADGVNLRTTVDFWAAVQEQSGPDYEEQGKPALDQKCTSLDGPDCDPVQKQQVLVKKRAEAKEAASSFKNLLLNMLQGGAEDSTGGKGKKPKIIFKVLRPGQSIDELQSEMLEEMDDEDSSDSDAPEAAEESALGADDEDEDDDDEDDEDEEKEDDDKEVKQKRLPKSLRLPAAKEGEEDDGLDDPDALQAQSSVPTTLRAALAPKMTIRKSSYMPVGGGYMAEPGPPFSLNAYNTLPKINKLRERLLAQKLKLDHRLGEVEKRVKQMTWMQALRGKKKKPVADTEAATLDLASVYGSRRGEALLQALAQAHAGGGTALVLKAPITAEAIETAETAETEATAGATEGGRENPFGADRLHVKKRLQKAKQQDGKKEATQANGNAARGGQSATKTSVHTSAQAGSAKDDSAKASSAQDDSAQAGAIGELFAKLLQGGGLGNAQASVTVKTVSVDANGKVVERLVEHGSHDDEQADTSKAKSKPSSKTARSTSAGAKSVGGKAKQAKVDGKAGGKAGGMAKQGKAGGTAKQGKAGGTAKQGKAGGMAKQAAKRRRQQSEAVDLWEGIDGDADDMDDL